MKFPFFSKPTESTAAPPSWPWPACGGNPKTLSFRVAGGNDIFKTINSAYVDDDSAVSELESCNVPDEDYSGTNESAVVVGALRSDRLFFQPGESSSILEAAKQTRSPDDGEAVSILALESRDPYSDFRSSMEEMVEAHELKDWECLEELLACYLRVNSKSNHGYIVGAFVDLLVHLAVASSAADTADASAIDENENCSSSSTTTTTQNSFTSPLSFSTSSTTATYSSASPRLSSPENEDPMTTAAAAGDKEAAPSPSSLSQVSN